MAMFHVHASVISKGNSPGGSTGFAQYIARAQPDKATQHTRYLARGEGDDTTDLVATGSGGLPRWAHDGAHFFAMADRYERKGATLARCYEIALPRELSPPARLELAQDIRATFFARSPHSWAVHCPVARDGQAQPHLHVIMSERGQMDTVDRSPQQYFARAAGPDQDPATHGVRKERSWQGAARLRELRAGVATLTNAALERAGLALAVSHETLRARGHDRAPEVDQGRQARYLHARYGIETRGWQETLAQRDVLHRDYHPWENELNRAAWYAQKQREHLHDLSREAMIDHVRDRFWRHDHSPARMQEREASLVRALERAYTEVPTERTRERQVVRGRAWALTGRLDDTPQGGMYVRDLEVTR